MSEPWEQYLRPTELQPSAAKKSGMDAYLDQLDRADAAVIKRLPPPDHVARSNEMARTFKLPPTIADSALPDLEKQHAINRTQEVARQYPAVGRWASDPRNAAVAADDYESLGLLGKGFYGLKNTGASIKAGLYTGTASLWGVVAGLSETAVSNSPIVWAENKVFGNSIENIMGTFARKQQKQGLAMADAARPRVDSWFARNLLKGVESVPVSVVAVGATAAGAPSTGVGVFAGSVGGNEYAKAREAGLSPNRAAIYGTGQAAIEYLTEKIPVSRLAGDIAAKSPVMKTLFRQLASEIPGEQVATLLQDFNEWATLNPEKTFRQFVDERPAAAAETLVATIGGIGFTTSLSVAAERTARAGVKIVDRVARSREAVDQADALGSVVEAASKSKTAGRDDVVFGELIRTMAEDAGSENAYIPAEAINAYMQMDGYDGSFDNYRDAVDEGLATGGDVVIPLSEAVPILAKGAWATLRDDVRLTPGGMSVREAQMFDEAMADVMAEISDKFAEQDRKIKADAEPRDRLMQSLADKLMNAGFTPNTARQQAELLTQRAATRSARMGQDLTGDEYNDLLIQQVLPEGLAQAQKADALDMTIGVMRKGKTGGSKRGPSLVDFIRSKGGIEDRGGDLAAMGYGPIKAIPRKDLVKMSRKEQLKRSRKYEIKLLRDYNPGQASMLGADGQENSNSPDELALRAWEAGYFPEFTERPSVNDLLEALAESVAGRDRFAQAADAQTEGLRKAAEELRALLENRGIDPDKASSKEIRSAVDAYVAEQAQGVGYDQLPDTIEIDGVQRPTVNSKGQPLAQTEEGVRAFWKWFGDSKVVDADGRPLVVYHGTGAGTEGDFAFDPRRISSNGSAEGYGFYFTTDRATAEGYTGRDGGSLVQAFVSMQNPMPVGQRALPTKQVEKVINHMVDAEIALGDVDDYKDTFISNYVDTYSVSRASAVREVARILVDSNDTAIDQIAELGNSAGSKVAAHEAVRDVTGFDGIVSDGYGGRGEAGGTIYVAWFPTQIKSVNNRGTFDASDPRILYQPAYHGSPHIFDKFSLDKIGTGEGAQAYGWGLYFAGKKEIAEHYRKILSEEVYVTKDGQTWSPDSLQHLNIRVMARRNGTDLQATIDQALAKLSDTEMRAADIAVLKDLIARGGIKKADGRLYQVEIPEDDEYLLWDAPLSEQPEKVKAALSSVMTPNSITGTLYPLTDMMPETERGNEIYLRLSGRVGGPRDASLALHDAGIAGIKYLDGGSRSKGDGTYNYVVFDDSRVSIQAYEQAYADGPRGRIVFPGQGYGQGKTVIEMFAARDNSTFLHETGHLWLEELRFDASDPNAPEQLKADWQQVADWFAANGHPLTDGAIPTEAHEMWARGVERYLMEGKAPVPALRKIFENFKSWLVQVYRTVAKLNSPITDDIRAVMDRLIATDEEIAQAREEQHLEAAFTEKPATMTEGEWTDYQAITSDAKSTAHDTLLAKVMSQVKRRVSKEYQDRKAAIRAEVTEEIDARPEFRAMRQLRATPVDAQWLKDGYGEDALALFPKSVPPLYKDGGANADEIAELTGFKSGDEMVRLLFGVEARRLQLREGGDKRSVREVLIAQETETRLTEQYGDPFTDGSIEEEALAAVHNERQGEVLAAELRVLSRASGDRPTPYRIAKAWAARTVREGIVRDVVSRSAIERYRRAAQKAGKASVDAILAGDNVEAFRQKQAQMLNNALVSEAQKVADEVEAAQARLEKIARKKTIKSVDQDYLERAQALMEQVELRPRSQRSLDRQAQFEAWATEQQANGHDIVVPASFAASLGTTNWTRLPVEQFLGLDAAVEQIIHLGRFKQTLLDNKEARDFDEIRSEALGQMGGMDKRPPSDLMEPSRWDGIKDRIAGADASLLKMETVFDWLDQGRSDGVFNRVVFQPIAEAQHNEQAMLREYVLKVQDLTKALPKQTVKRWRDKFTDQRLLNRATGNPWVLSRDQLISIALNMGNASNRAKLTGGYGWNEQAVMDVLNESLSDAEWQYVQAIWDTIESLWPQIEAMEKRVNGIAPEKIESAPITTSAGVLRGGYYPVVYDPRQSLDAELHGQKSGDALFENNYTRAATSRGFTKERTNVERPIHLSLSVIERHLSEVIHDLTHREAVMQADKFLTDRRIVAAVDETLGPEVRRQFRPWLQHIANEWAYDRAGGAAAEKFLRAMRRNATFVGMAFRASTVFMQAAGFSDSAGTIGAKAMMHGLQAFGRNPKQAIDFVLERSGEVRARMDTLDRDIREAARRHAGEKQILSAAQRFGYMGIGYMDRLVVVPTWIGAYDKALAAGKDEQAAIYEADKAVRVSQGSGAAKDLASVQRGRGTAGEAMKLMTMFYSYASGYYQRLRTLGRDVRKANASDIPNLVARSFFLVIAPALLAELLAGRGPDEDDEEGWAEWAFQKIALSVFNPIPLLRDVLPPAVAAAQDKPTFGYSFTPVAKMGDTFVNLARDAGNVIEGEETKRATRNFLEGVGYVTGLVPGQIATSAQFLVDVAYGDQDPETFGDWYSGITSGKVSD